MACFRDFVSDFDLMLQHKKDEMKKRRRRRRDVDIINDNDDLIEDIIRRMMEAAEVCTRHVLSCLVPRVTLDPLQILH